VLFVALTAALAEDEYFIEIINLREEET